MRILGIFVVLAIADVFTGDGFTFLTTVTEPPSEEFSSVTMHDSCRKFLVGAVTAVSQGYHPLHTQHPYTFLPQRYLLCQMKQHHVLLKARERAPVVGRVTASLSFRRQFVGVASRC
jgi:hypothetical protein